MTTEREFLSFVFLLVRLLKSCLTCRSCRINFPRGYFWVNRCWRPSVKFKYLYQYLTTYSFSSILQLGGHIHLPVGLNQLSSTALPAQLQWQEGWKASVAPAWGCVLCSHEQLFSGCSLEGCLPAPTGSSCSPSVSSSPLPVVVWWWRSLTQGVITSLVQTVEGWIWIPFIILDGKPLPR